jgi:hypothetical protein
MQTHRHIKLALICTVALAVPASAATAGILTPDGPPAAKAKVYRHACPVNNPEYIYGPPKPHHG